MHCSTKHVLQNLWTMLNSVLEQVPPNYDSLLGKLIVWAEDRPQAIARMKRALNECVISGVPTTCLYHTMILDLPDFKNGNVDTGFIQKHQDELSTPKMAPTKSVSALPSSAQPKTAGSWSALAPVEGRHRPV